MMLRRTIVVVLDYSLLLLLGAVAGFAWANVAPETYTRVVGVLHFAVNDVGMAFFFAIAAKEVVEATLPGGPLASPRRAAVPLLAAVGGMVMPALIYVGLAAGVGHHELLRGWAIPCATDIAFSYLVVRLIFGPRHPIIPFLLLLAIADDAIGLLILAVFYPAGDVRFVEFAALLAVALGMAWMLRRRRTLTFWPYVLVAGSVAWIAFLKGGLHPALALVPIVPFIPHGAHADADLGLAHQRSHDDPLSRFDEWWRIPVQMILFFFGLINAGVPIGNIGVGTGIVMAALLLGKPLGILLFTAVAVGIGLHRPPGVDWLDVAVVGTAAGIGFTVALFFATAAFEPGQWLDQTKMGALLSVAAAIVALGLARLLRVGRFRAPHTLEASR